MSLNLQDEVEREVGILQPSRVSKARIFMYTVALFSTVVIGGVLNRIHGGLIKFPDITIGDPKSDIILHGLLEHLVIAALPTGLLSVIVTYGSSREDKYFLKKVSLFLSVTLSIWFSYYIGNDVYMQIGRNYTTAYCSYIGVFDWAIGHECKGFTYWRSWLHQILGMSMGGLIQTVPPGLCIFIFGYGWEYLLCGVFAGAIFDIAQRIPLSLVGLESGVNLAQFLWGGWLWLILSISILARRKNPSATPKLFHTSHVAFWVFMVALDVLFVGSCITYANVEQDDMLYRDQSLMGLGVVTGSVLLCEGVYVVAMWYYGRKRKIPKHLNYVIIDGIDNIKMVQAVDQWNNNSKFQMFRKLIIPPVQSPWKVILSIIRVLLLLWLTWTVVLFVYVVVQDRILGPCDIYWKWNDRNCWIL